MKRRWILVMVVMLALVATVAQAAIGRGMFEKGLIYAEGRTYLVSDGGWTLSELLPPEDTRFYEATMDSDGRVAAVAVDPYYLTGGVWVWDQDSWTQWSPTGIEVRSLGFVNGMLSGRDYQRLYLILPPVATIDDGDAEMRPLVTIYTSSEVLMGAGSYREGIPITEQQDADWHNQRLRVVDLEGTVIYDSGWAQGDLYNDLALSPNGSELLLRATNYIDYSSTVRLYDLESGTFQDLIADTPTTAITATAWLPDGGNATAMEIWRREQVIGRQLLFTPAEGRQITNRVRLGSISHMDLY